MAGLEPKFLLRLLLLGEAVTIDSPRPQIVAVLRRRIELHLIDPALISTLDSLLTQVNTCGFTDEEMGVTPRARQAIDAHGHQMDEIRVTTLRQSGANDYDLLLSAIHALAERLDSGRTTPERLGLSMTELQACYDRTMRLVVAAVRQGDKGALLRFWGQTEGPELLGSQFVQRVTPAAVGLAPDEFAYLLVLARDLTMPWDE